MKNSLLLPLLFTVCLPSLADIYKWTDKDGNVHFGDRPTTNDIATVIQQKKTNSSAMTIPKEDTWQQDYQTAKKEKLRVKAKKEEHDNKINAACDQLKIRLAVYTQSGRIYSMSANGERTYRSREEIDKEKSQLNKIIKKNCR